MNRYHGTLMYCTFLPFSIYAPDEKEAIAQLQKNAPELLGEAEKKELMSRLVRIPKADRVSAIRKEAQSERKHNNATSTHETH